ncbi:MAG: type I-E CRISPR-associated protein Cse1/CasA, partial [bacterium]
MKKFNLIEEEWISAVKDKEIYNISLMECLKNPCKYDFIYDNNALNEFSMYLLIWNILHRSLGQINIKEWSNIWNSKSWGNAPVEYLEKWEDRFFLFHPTHPFYQYSNTICEKSEYKNISKIVPQLPSGNNNLFFMASEKKELSLSYKDSIKYLLSYQYFCPQEASYVLGPYSKAIHSFIKGSNLFETMMLNYITNTDITGIPCWEIDDYCLYSPKESGILHNLTLLSRRIKLEDSTNCVDGFYMNFLFKEKETKDEKKIIKNNIREFIKAIKDNNPFISTYKYTQKEKGEEEEKTGVYEFQNEKASWRNLHSILNNENNMIIKDYTIFKMNNIESYGYINFINYGAEVKTAGTTGLIKLLKKNEYLIPFNILVKNSDIEEDETKEDKIESLVEKLEKEYKEIINCVKKAIRNTNGKNKKEKDIIDPSWEKKTSTMY